MTGKREVVFGINDSIAYQEGSIVSREIIAKDCGTVTLFAFDAGQGLSEHTAPFDALVHVVDGEALITIEGEQHVLKAGQLVIMPANRPHAVKAEHPFKMVLTMVKSPSQ